MGQREKAEEIIKRLLEALPGNDTGLYYAARIYAVLGEKEKAMEFLIQWRKGWGGRYSSYHLLKYDYFMKNLFGYPPFEEHMRVRDEGLQN